MSATCIECGEDATTTIRCYTGPDTYVMEPACAICKDANDNYEPPEPDGEAFRGGEAAAYQREQSAAAWRLK